MNQDSALDLAPFQHALNQVFAPWVRDIGLSMVRAKLGEVTLALPVAPKHVHGGGVMCGQTMMAAADTAMVLAVMTHLGEFKPMTTIQLQTSFLRPIPGADGEARVVARVLRMGRSVVFGEVDVLGPDGKLAAHATTSYMLL